MMVISLNFTCVKELNQVEEKGRGGIIHPECLLHHCRSNQVCEQRAVPVLHKQ